MTLRSRMVGLAALVLAAGALGGCYAEEGLGPMSPEGEVEVEAYQGYRPPYYDGYVVYYDANARPYYYAGGRPFYVSSGYAGYGGLVAHYHGNTAAYAAWHAQHGARYRGYRSRGRRR